MKTDVTIIIPVYNVAPYIEACLQSVMRQSYAGLMECLIVDDCGTDESISTAERLIAEYKGPIRFEIHHHQYNKGLSSARNTGMEKAEGDFLFFLDSDDEISEDCLEKMMAVVREFPDVEMVQGMHITHRGGKELRRPKEVQIMYAQTNDEVRKCFYEYGQISVAAWNKLMKRSFIEDNHLSFVEGLLYEDTPWTFFWLKYVKNACFLSDVTYHYRIRHHSIVTGTSRETTDIHRLRGFHGIITHLTPGCEKQELDRFAHPFISLFLHHSYHMPELTEDLKILWRSAWESRQIQLCGTFGICFVFRRSKWLGRIVYSCLARLKKPSQIPRDIVRLWRWIKR